MRTEATLKHKVLPKKKKFLTKWWSSTVDESTIGCGCSPEMGSKF